MIYSAEMNVLGDRQGLGSRSKMTDARPYLILLLAVCATSVSGQEDEAPDGPENKWVPGELIILIDESSHTEVDRAEILEGNLMTGIASLDSLNQSEGMLKIESVTSSTTPPPSSFVCTS